MSLQAVEKYFEEGIQAVEKFVIPVAQVAVSCSPGMPPIVGQIVGALPALMTSAEQILPADGSGPLKQAGVMGFLQAICVELDKTLTGGAHNTFAEISPIALSVIQNGMAVINSKNLVADPKLANTAG